jgi:hypothetical protein
MRLYKPPQLTNSTRLDESRILEEKREIILFMMILIFEYLQTFFERNDCMRLRLEKWLPDHTVIIEGFCLESQLRLDKVLSAEAFSKLRWVFFRCRGRCLSYSK